MGREYEFQHLSLIMCGAPALIMALLLSISYLNGGLIGKKDDILLAVGAFALLLTACTCLYGAGEHRIKVLEQEKKLRVYSTQL